MGIDPGPRTLRELDQMYAACQRARWDHTASLMAHLANLQRTSESQPVHVSGQYHPMVSPEELEKERQRRKAMAPKAPIGVLKSVFVSK